jgi:hypothetical protein
MSCRNCKPNHQCEQRAIESDDGKSPLSQQATFGCGGLVREFLHEKLSDSKGTTGVKPEGDQMSARDAINDEASEWLAPYVSFGGMRVNQFTTSTPTTNAPMSLRYSLRDGEASPHRVRDCGTSALEHLAANLSVTS